MKKLLIIILLFFTKLIVAQDIVYTQTFGAPMYLNPAFTGNLAKTSFYLNARQQWQSLDGGYVTSSFAANHRLDNINSGIGLMVKQNEEGAAKYISTNISGIYSYILHINKEWTISPAIEVTYISRRFDKTSFVFGDQINDDFSISESTSDNINLSNRSNLDFSTGAIIYNSNFWLGASTHHLTQPNDFNKFSSLNKKISLHTGYQFEHRLVNFKETLFFSPSININIQNPFLRSGINLISTYRNFSIGSGIANITSSFSNQNILNSFILIGFSDEHFKVGYSYDFTLRGATGFGGAHEITLGILLNYDNNSNPNPLKHKKIRKVSCPKF